MKLKREDALVQMIESPVKRVEDIGAKVNDLEDAYRR